MFHLSKYQIYLAAIFFIFSSNAGAILPAVCDPEYKDKVLPYVQELERKGPTKLMAEIRNTKSTDLVEYHMTYGLNIRNNWFHRKGKKLELMRIYANKLGIHHIDDMSQDLIEGIWINNKKDRCEVLIKEHELLEKDRGQVEIIAPSVVPVVDVLKDPNSFHDSIVTIVGRLDLEFEKQTLTNIDCFPSNPKSPNQIWVDFSKLDLVKLGNPNHVNSKVTGKFSKTKKGHFGMFPGSIEVTKIEVLDAKYSGCNSDTTH